MRTPTAAEAPSEESAGPVLVGVAALAAALAAAESVRLLYLAAEVAALEALRRAVTGLLQAPGLPDRVGARMLLGRRTRAIAADTAAQARPLVAAAVRSAHRTGDAEAARDLNLPDSLPGFPPSPRVDIAHTEIPAAVDDAYRRIVRQALAVEPGRGDRRRVAQRVLDEFATAGIPSFTDRAGRRWSIDAYAEMAVRTALSRARVDAYLSRVRVAGVEFVRVVSRPGCCGLCAPYAGKTIAVADIDDARAAGLLHPNCRCSLSAATGRPVVVAGPQPDPAAFRDRQKLRYLERRVRAARRREAVALDPTARAKATADVRAGHAAIRAHIQRTGLVRQRRRERITTVR